MVCRGNQREVRPSRHFQGYPIFKKESVIRLSMKPKSNESESQRITNSTITKFYYSQNVETKKKESFSVPWVTFPEYSFPKQITQRTNMNT